MPLVSAAGSQLKAERASSWVAPRPPAPPPTLRHLALDASLPPPPEADAYLVAGGGPDACYRVTPPRAEGSRAWVRWALDGHGRPTALHTLRAPDAAFALADQEVELAAMQALGEGLLPRGHFVDEAGRRTLALPLWHADLFYLSELALSDQARRIVGRKLLRDVADNLVKLHAAELVHNDIKPENIFYRTDGSFTLADFDSAYRDDASGKERVVQVGSPAYPVPEFFTPTLPLGRASDLFKFGLTLLCFYGGATYDDYCANDYTGRIRRRSGVSWAERPRTSLLLLEAYLVHRKGKPAPPLEGWPEALQRRWRALATLAQTVRRVDPAVETIVFDHLLQPLPQRRPTAERLQRWAYRLLPPASAAEQAAGDCLRAPQCQPDVVRQQAQDLARLAQLPAAPPPPKPTPLLFRAGLQRLRTGLTQAVLTRRWPAPTPSPTSHVGGAAPSPMAAALGAGAGVNRGAGTRVVASTAQSGTHAQVSAAASRRGAARSH